MLVVVVVVVVGQASVVLVFLNLGVRLFVAVFFVGWVLVGGLARLVGLGATANGISDFLYKQ